MPSRVRERTQKPGAPLLACAAFTILAGCKQIQERIAAHEDEKAVEAASSGTIQTTTGSGTVAVHGPSGVTASGGENAKVPDEWPASVPLYPGGTLKSAVRAPGAFGPGSSVQTLSYETPDEPTKALSFYQSGLTGFTKGKEIDLGGNLLASFESDKLSVALTIARAAGAKVSVVHIMVSSRS